MMLRRVTNNTSSYIKRARVAAVTRKFSDDATSTFIPNSHPMAQEGTPNLFKDWNLPDPGKSNHKKCTECGIQMLKKNFARHMRDMHTATPKPRSLCPLCQKSYKTQDWLKDHIRRGHGYTKELTDQVMASLETNSNSTNSESCMKKLSLEETKLPPLINLKEPASTSNIAMIDISSQPITILASHTVVKE